MDKNSLKFGFLSKKNITMMFLVSGFFTVLAFAIFIVNEFVYVNSKANNVKKEIYNIIAQDTGIVHSELQIKLNLLHFTNNKKDKFSSMEVIHNKFKNPKSEAIYYKNNSHLLKNEGISFGQKKQNAVIFDYGNIIVSGKETIEHKNNIFTIVVFESLFTPFLGRATCFFIAGTLYVLCFGFLFLLAMLYSKFSYLNKISSSLALIRHDFESFLSNIEELELKTIDKTYVVAKLRRAHMTMIDIYKTKKVNYDLLKKLLTNIKSYDHYDNHGELEEYRNIFIECKKFYGAYIIEPRILYSVILNVIENAFALPAESDTVDIKCSEENGKKLIIKLINYGQRIDEEVQKKLFKEKITKGKPKGKGYGLFECKKLLKKNGADIILFESTEYQTEFRIYLYKKEYEKMNTNKNYSNVTQKVKKVILLEDNMLYIKKMTQKLHKFDITYFTEPDEFFEHLESKSLEELNEHDIICDYYYENASDYKNLKVYEKLRKMGFKNKIILYSSGFPLNSKYDFFAEKGEEGYEQIAQYLNH